jgi:hypothetical protein
VSRFIGEPIGNRVARLHIAISLLTISMYWKGPTAPVESGGVTPGSGTNENSPAADRPAAFRVPPKIAVAGALVAVEALLRPGEAVFAPELVPEREGVLRNAGLRTRSGITAGNSVVGGALAAETGRA